MARTKSPAARAYFQLADLARKDGYGGVTSFALAWLAAGRMVVSGNALVHATIEQLADVSTWKALVEAGLPAEAMDYAAIQRNSIAISDISRRAAATSIVADLHRELGSHPWDILPCVIDGDGGRRELEGTVIPELAALLLDLVGQPDQSELWIPFDPKGQLTIEAVRRGWRVLTASPLSAWTIVPQLLLTIESGSPQHCKVRQDIERDVHGRPTTRADYALVIPPFGVQVKDSRMATWDASGGKGFEQFARSETWAIHEFVNRTNKRAVFPGTSGRSLCKRARATLA